MSAEVSHDFQGESVLDLVKEAIRKIKQQKQRPGFDRISQCLKTHNGMNDPKMLRETLDSALRKGHLLTVWTKGLQCYKDPEALRQLRKFAVGTPADARRAVKAAVREIGDSEGSKQTTLLNYIKYSFTIKTTDLPGLVSKACEHLVQKGDLSLLNDRYKPAHYNTVTAKPIPGGEPTMDDFAIEAEDDDVDMEQTQASIKATKNGNGKHEESDSGFSVGDVKRETDEPNSSSTDGQTAEAFLYQCWCCSVFVAKPEDLIKHVGSNGHQKKTGDKIVYCSSCRFRSRQSDRLLAHLTKHQCHAESGLRPACMLSFNAVQRR